MHTLSKILFTAVLIFLLAPIASAKNDTATIIQDQSGLVYVEVHLTKTTPASAPAGELLLLHDDGTLELVTNTITNMSANFDTFRFTFPDAPPTLAFNADNSYTVELLVPTNQAKVAKTFKIEIQAASALSLSLGRSLLGITARCGDGITLEVATALNNYNWDALFQKLDQLEPHPKQFATVKIHTQGDDETSWPEYPLKSVSDEMRPQAPAQKHLRMCLLTEKSLPTGTLDVEVSFNQNRPADFAQKITKKSLPGTAVGASPKAEDPGSPEKRLIEQNLDMGVSLTSSVADEETPATATKPAITKRIRTTRGILDVRFAPVLDVLHPTIEDNKWMHFLTPFFLNANVATGKITKDTLSLNRVLIGLQGQFRKRFVFVDANGHTHKISTQRIIYGFTHASDRDFKQDEFTGKIEWAPIFWKLNQPISLNYTVNTRKEDVPGSIGYTFLPKVGFEIGRTYHRRNPAPDIELSPTVKRFYFGVDMSLDLTRHLTLSVSDVAYVRGEAPGHRFRNYFKGGVEAPMGRVFGSAVHSLFFTFEKGDQAPFATPAVNSVKVGYRVQY
jgi:hypothetical protein